MPQTENLRRAALVTGGAKGIGRAICRALAENGMNIAVNYAGSAAAAEETAAACRALGVQAVTLQADVRSPRSMSETGRRYRCRFWADRCAGQQRGHYRRQIASADDRG